MRFIALPVVNCAGSGPAEPSSACVADRLRPNSPTGKVNFSRRKSALRNGPPRGELPRSPVFRLPRKTSEQIRGRRSRGFASFPKSQVNIPSVSHRSIKNDPEERREKTKRAQIDSVLLRFHRRSLSFFSFSFSGEGCLPRAFALFIKSFVAFLLFPAPRPASTDSRIAGPFPFLSAPPPGSRGRRTGRRDYRPEEDSTAESLESFDDPNGERKGIDRTLR